MSSAIFSKLIIRIRSNLYTGFGVDHLLGVDLGSKELNVKILVNVTLDDE